LKVGAINTTATFYKTAFLIAFNQVMHLLPDWGAIVGAMADKK
jgi:hypothetical protein